MESIQDQLIQEIRKTPASLQQQILDFVRFLNQHHSRPTQENIEHHELLSVEDDPIVGIYAGSPNLSEQSEDILEADIQTESGWTWKA
jgi:hypothetical protein